MRTPTTRQCKHVCCGDTCHREPAKKKDPTPIKKMADSRKEAEKIYMEQARLFREKNPMCQVKSPVCTRRTQGVHHLAGRIGDKLLDEKYWMPSCNACNLYVEEHSAWAYENGKKLSKFTPNV